MMMDVDQAAKAMRDDEMLAEIEDFTEACGSTASGSLPGRPEMGGPRDTRPGAEWLQ